MAINKQPSAVQPTGPDLKETPGPGEPEPGTNPAIEPGHDEPPVDPAPTESIGVPTMATSFPSSMVEPDYGAGGEPPIIESDPLNLHRAATPDAPGGSAPEPERPRPSEEPAPDAGQGWSSLNRHADLDDYLLTRSDLQEPEEWAGLTVAEKKAWLDRNG